MIQSDPIVALATTPGVGAISVIRISGDDTLEIISKFFNSSSGKILKKQKNQTVHLGEIVENDQIIDQVLVSIFKKPHSYTGEDVVEISCHGSNFIQQEIIQLFLRNGCRLADHGEFTMRAFLNGKMDLSQAEAVADVIASNSRTSHQIAIQQMRGGIANELLELRVQLLDFAALIELELDFSGEDIEFADRTKFKELVAVISKILKRLIDSFSFGNAMKNGIPIAIIGAPNVGKSTLLNTLLNEEKAIVSDIAGTTRDAVEDELVVEGVSFRFIDTAGIRETDDVVENIGIRKTYEKAENAQLIIFLLDAREFSVSKNACMSEINVIKNRFPKKRICVIANKIDSISETQKNEISLAIKDVLLLSAKQKIGIDRLLKKLTSFVNKGKLSTNDTIVTNSRHFEALSNALDALISVERGIALGISTDLLSIDIRECLRHLGNITGEYDIDKDILGHIFSNFCIGK